MKKALLFVCSAVMLCLTAAVSYSMGQKQVAATILDDYSLTYNGSNLIFKGNIVMIDGKTYVPLREFAEKLDIFLEWTPNNNISLEQKGTNGIETGIEPYALSEYSFVGDDWVVFQGENGLYGYKDADGKVVIEPQFEGACEFSEGRALVYESHEGETINDVVWEGYIDVKGNLVIPYKFCSSGANFGADRAFFRNGVAKVTLSNFIAESIYINRNGENAFNKKFIRAKTFSEGLAAVMISGPRFVAQNPPPEKWSFIDEKGEFATEKVWDYVYPFQNGRAKVKLDGKWMYIDKNFEVIEYIG